MQIRNLLLCLIFVLTPLYLFAHPNVQLLDENGNPIKDVLDTTQKIVLPDGSVYIKGPAYSPKKTCGKCHDYNAITKAYHFREGVGPDGTRISDTWSSDNKNNPLQKYLSHAYGYILSPGQYGAW